MHFGHTEWLSIPWHSVHQTQSSCMLCRQSTHATRQSRGLHYAALSLQNLYDTLSTMLSSHCVDGGEKEGFIQFWNFHFPVKAKACPLGNVVL